MPLTNFNVIYTQIVRVEVKKKPKSAANIHIFAKALIF